MRKEVLRYFQIQGLLCFLLTFCTLFAKAYDDIPVLGEDVKIIYSDTTTYVAPTQTEIQTTKLSNPYQVVTNKFGKNWYIFASGGVHSFFGDYSNLGAFKGTLSPDYGLGFGKWFTPGVAVQLEFIKSDSRGYTSVENGHYGYGDVLQNSKGDKYMKMKTSWWDASMSVVFNLTRLINGYEGYGSPHNMNQFLVSAGLGIVHHLGYGKSYGSDNELSAHLELAYSRFFNRRKNFSLDFKARGIFYESNFDLEYGQGNYSAKKVDFNIGFDIGLTYYFGGKKSNGWGQSTTEYYTRDYREQKIVVVGETPQPEPVSNRIEMGTITFYVFYPNNYSGRNDAPLEPTSPVNAIEYLAGGIFTQNQFVNTSGVTSRLLKGQALNDMATVDIPTEQADKPFAIDFIPRGYEMDVNKPISLSLLPDDMLNFRERAGYYYAPIYDGRHVWMYRVDNAAMGQQLANEANYKETESFGLNSKYGMNIIEDNMDLADDDVLVSFADMYAALNENTGHIAGYTDAENVERIKDILDNGVITMIQAEGFATSQDNSVGPNAQQIGIDRNTALSQNRANTVISWLKNSNDKLNFASSQIYLLNNSLSGPIRNVTDKSTRGLNAKMNRFVKVRIHYMKK